MVVKNSPAATASSKKKPQEPVKLVYLILLIGYGFVTVLTPELGTLDSNGPKFLSLAMFNLVTFIFLFTRKEIKFRPEWYFAFFKNGLGLLYCGLMVVSLLSFFKAYNLLESVLHFSKIFTTFSAAYLVSILVLADRRNIKYLCVAMTLLLIYDSWAVFAEFIAGKSGSVSEIKLGYSNKNILASAIFVKIPFALYLFIFNHKWWRALGIIGILLSITATLFMSARAFYLGNIALTVILLFYFGQRFWLSKDKFQLKLAGIYLMLVLSSYLVFTSTQYALRPKAEAKAFSVEGRLATITGSDGGGGRLAGWKRSWHVFKENPLLGVGLGNWKIATLKEENLTFVDDSVVLYKAHNDFIETATETGIFGGVLFIMLFMLTGWVFIRTLIRKPNTEWLPLLFLPSFGLFCYSFDAFFNFPQDRPQMGVLFAFYTGMAIALTTLFADELTSESLKEPGGQRPTKHVFQPLPKISFPPVKLKKTTNHLFQLPLIIAYGMMISLSTYILFLNFNSLKLQRLVSSDVKLGKLTHPSSLFLNGFPVIPDLNSYSVPIDADKARYLLNENRNDEVIALLKKNKSNPYDEMVPAFISMAYRNQNKIDSVQTYIQKAYNIRPNKYKNVSNLCVILEQKGLVKEAEVILNKYLEKNKNNSKAWLFALDFYNRNGNTQKAINVIDSAAYYFPADTLVLKQKKTMDRKAIFLPYQQLYNAAFGSFKAKKYAEAVRDFTEILSKEPNYTDARRYRAFSLQCIKEYEKSNLDLNFLIPIREPWTVQYNPYNLRGVNYWYMGKREDACKNFKIATEMGDKEGTENYSKLCQKGK